jgi:hypothetical protein
MMLLTVLRHAVIVRKSLKLSGHTALGVDTDLEIGKMKAQYTFGNIALTESENESSTRDIFAKLEARKKFGMYYPHLNPLNYTFEVVEDNAGVYTILAMEK